MYATVTNRFLRNELDNFENTNDIDKIYGDLKYSVLIIPSKGKDFARIDIDGRELIPVFTDIHEYNKQNLDADFRPVAYYFNYYLDLLEGNSPDLIINPKSERFIITDRILDVMDTDYMFELDYQPFMPDEIQEMYESMDNSKLREFKKSGSWDMHELMKILMHSDLLTLIGTEKPLDEIEDMGVYDCIGKTWFQAMDNYVLLFSKHVVGQNQVNSYSQFVNLPQFIDGALKHDISGIILDNSIVLPREFLIDYMRSSAIPQLEDYTFYAFSLEGNGGE